MQTVATVAATMLCSYAVRAMMMESAFVSQQRRTTLVVHGRVGTPYMKKRILHARKVSQIVLAPSKRMGNVALRDMSLRHATGRTPLAGAPSLALRITPTPPARHLQCHRQGHLPLSHLALPRALRPQ